jgi:hypothetical protein
MAKIGDSAKGITIAVETDRPASLSEICPYVEDPTCRYIFAEVK